MNAINTTDSKSYKANKTYSYFDSLRNLNITLGSTLAVLTGSILMADSAAKNIKKSGYLPLTISSGIAAAVLYTHNALKRADSNVKAEKLGIYETQTEYSNNPKIFVKLDDEQEQQIHSTNIYRYYNNKEYVTQDSLIDYNRSEEKQNIDKYESELKNYNSEFIYKTECTNTDDVKNIVNEVDRQAFEYSNRVIKGANNAAAIAGCAGMTIATLVEHLLHKTKKISPLSSVVPIAVGLLPSFFFSKAVNTNSKDLYQISRYKAKYNVINEINTNNNSSVSEFWDYYSNRKKYKSEIEKQCELTNVRNKIMTNSSFTDSEIKEGTKTQATYNKAVSDDMRIKKIKNNSRKESLLTDVIPNTAAIVISPILFLIANRILTVPALSNRNITYTVLGINTSASIINSVSANLILKNKN